MKRWHFYDSSTGLFIGKSVGCTNARTLVAKPPAGCEAVEGEFDCLSQRVNVESGVVVDYQPDKPDDDHEWIHDDPLTGARVRRWVLKREAAERRAAQAASASALAQLEPRQLRSLTEIVLALCEAFPAGRGDALNALKARNEQLDELAIAAGMRKPPLTKPEDP